MRTLSFISVLFLSILAHAASPADCSEMEAWDVDMAMCMPHAMAGMAMKMAMLHYNSFLLWTHEQGPRGRDAFSVPDMAMADVGSSLGDHQYLNVELMATLERWTFPDAGTPELLQIGEENMNHQPYLDAQHPHSSPIMGLTFSDTISLGKDRLKLFFAPRGASTDGPIAFMHRPTGEVNPDAPLGHHIGQDVGHISSTVVGASLQLAQTTLEASTFNGTEPKPTEVDLPMATPNSFAVRLVQAFDPRLFAMASAAFVKSPEPTDPDLDHVWRYSASIYHERLSEGGWRMNSAFIWGLINGYDHAAALNSIAEEFRVERERHRFWGRIESLQRTPAELSITSTSPNDPQWVTAITLGYTHHLADWELAEVGLGGALTQDLLPTVYQDAYGGNPITAKIFLQVGGMKMWNL